MAGRSPPSTNRLAVGRNAPKNARGNKVLSRCSTLSLEKADHAWSTRCALLRGGRAYEDAISQEKADF